MAGSRNARDDMVACPCLEAAVLELFAVQCDLNVVVDPLDDAEGNPRRTGLRVRAEPSVYTGEPPPETAPQARAERTQSRQDVADVWVTSVGWLFELEVVDLACHSSVRIEDLSVEQRERGEDAPSPTSVAHAPPFDAIISGIVASDTTIRMPMYTVAMAFNARELTLSPMKSGSFATTRMGK